MILLAISTSAKDPSAALLMPDGKIIMKKDASGKPHSVSLMPLLDELICETGLEPTDLDGICVDIGPGSFTGVRIGVSAANAMAEALKKPVYPVSALAALRHRAKNEKGRVLCMIDAKNGNGYAASYENGECILPPCACVQNEIIEKWKDKGDFILVGDCKGHTDYVDAALVLMQARYAEPAESAVPLYLRPSQAERGRKAGI